MVTHGQNQKQTSQTKCFLWSLCAIVGHLVKLNNLVRGEEEQVIGIFHVSKGSQLIAGLGMSGVQFRKQHSYTGMLFSFRLWQQQ